MTEKLNYRQTFSLAYESVLSYPNNLESIKVEVLHICYDGHDEIMLLVMVCVCKFQRNDRANVHDAYIIEMKNKK